MKTYLKVYNPKRGRRPRNLKFMVVYGHDFGEHRWLQRCVHDYKRPYYVHSFSEHCWEHQIRAG